MKVKLFQLLKEGKQKLKNADLPEIEARLLLEYVMKMSFTELINHYHKTIDEKNVEIYDSMIQRRLERVPLQQITNEQIFYGNYFYINEHVLIPRPETEMLVELGIDFVKKLYVEGLRHIKIIDMCTGSGCIALSIGNFFASSQKFNDLKLEIIASDISLEALKVATKNGLSINHNNSVKFVQSDLFESIKWMEVDLLISNPPYITPEDINLLMPEVRDFEPRLALDGGLDGLDFYRSMTLEASKRLKNHGGLMFEIGHGQMEDIKRILETENFKGVSGKMDYQEFERIVYGIKLNKPD